MADRHVFASIPVPDADLLGLLDAVRDQHPSEDEVREQRISFAYGNVMESDTITKESVRLAAQSILFLK